MSYLVLARKYRPQTLEEVVGQDAIAATLRRAIDTDRVAHAILFSGSRGVGKTSMARILAKSLNCEGGPTPDPCNRCDVCRSITAGNDLDVIEIDGASNNRVDEIRELRDNVRLVTARSRFKIYIIDEIHMLSVSAFNALLKTLEEPPPHVKFIFATTSPQKLPETIHSRCQRFDFHPISEARIRQRLEWICGKEEIGFEEGALSAVARAGRGSMRDALTILDQVVIAGEEGVTRRAVLDVLGIVPGEVVSQLVDSLGRGEGRGVLDAVRGVADSGRDLATFVTQIVGHLRALMLASAGAGTPELLGRTGEETERIVAQARGLDLDRILYMIQVLDAVQLRMRTSEHPRVLLEAALLKLARRDEWRTLREILALLEGSGAGPKVAHRRGAPAAAASPVPAAAARGASPGSSPPPSPPTRAAPDALTLDRVRGGWADLVEALRARGKASVGAFLAEGEPVRLEEGRLWVAYPEAKRFSARQLEREDVRRHLDAASRAVLGGSLRFVAEFRREGAPPQGKGGPRAPSPGGGDPAVKRVVDLFDGRIVGREDG